MKERLSRPHKRPDPQKLTIKELQDVYLEISQEFTTRLEYCRDVSELKELQLYLRSIRLEIQHRQRSS